jgi:hypothetical protein
MGKLATASSACTGICGAIGMEKTPEVIRSQRSSGRGTAWAVGYAALCAVMAVVGWMAVMAAVPGVKAGGLASSSMPSDRPAAGATPSASASPNVALASVTLSTPFDPAPTPVASPTKTAFTIDVYRPGTFVTQNDREYCMAGAVQNMLNIIGPSVDLTTTKQEQIGSLLVSLTTTEDSYDGGFGPGGWALAMPKLGAGNYKLVVDPTFSEAMKDAAMALSQTGRPVGLLTWYGAHSWVMTGFKADADPLLFPNTFQLKGAFIVDPFYPRLSSIWGQTLGPDTYRDMAAMAQNYLGWKRPEGHYPTRDGKWLLVVPVD